ncbi:uncharacterized protein NPIL_179012 [Nephila pilipes]|uniref:Ig-like domain-containing protein n=1 Tax=Nephila pilipes TaxID=299642 RepID=A0A8X6NCR3_NEPPI|nr:uncharacterized protein NPIL_179012 [Nephila pilipes]
MAGSKNVPVLLFTGTLNRNVRLPCHYCSEKPGISGRKWRKRNLHGNMSDVVLDMHDNPDKNRIFVNPDHSLSIQKVRREDGGYYFCYDVEDKQGTAKMDILLDEAIPAVSKYECYAEWGTWSKCNACGKIGQRTRVGECRLQRFVKAQMKTPEGSVVEADFPIVGVGCHSLLLAQVRKASWILSRVPNIVVMDLCKVSCVGQVTKPPSKLGKLLKASFLNKVRLKVMKKLKEVSPNVTFETKTGSEGTKITLYCPGANIDLRVKWKYKMRPLKPDKLKERTLGRMNIDATDALHINELRVTDAGEYTCTLYDVEIGIIRLKDPTTNFGILSLTLLFSFILWVVLMAVRWKNFKMQREAQQTRNRRQLPEEETDDTESLLSSAND